MSKVHFNVPARVVVTLAGPTKIGKTTVGKKLVAILCKLGFAAVYLENGTIYRLLAHQALLAATPDKPARDFTADELVTIAKAQGVQILNGFLCYRHSRYLEFYLHTPEVDQLVPIWGNEPAANTYAEELIRTFMAGFDGIVVLGGRTVNVDYREQAGRGRFYLDAAPEVRATRSGRSVESILARDQADTHTGALTGRPVGWYFEISDDALDADEVVCVILEWLLGVNEAPFVHASVYRPQR